MPLGGTLAFAVASDHPDAVGPLAIADMVPFLAGTAMQVRSLDEASFAGQYEKVSRLHFVLAETTRHFIVFDDPSWFFAQLDAATRKRGFDDE